MIPDYADFPHLMWVVLDIEYDCQAPLWKAIKSELQPNSKYKNVDQALRAAASSIKSNFIAVNNLSLIRYADIATSKQLAIGHPLFPFVLQRFFILYFGRPETANGEGWAVGERILNSNSSCSSLFKRLIVRLAESVNEVEPPIKLASYYQACNIWINDNKLLEPNVYLPTLNSGYFPEKLIQVFQNENSLW